MVAGDHSRTYIARWASSLHKLFRNSGRGAALRATAYK